LGSGLETCYPNYFSNVNQLTPHNMDLTNVLDKHQTRRLLDALAGKGRLSNNPNVARQQLYDEYGVDADVKIIKQYSEPTLDEIVQDKKSLINTLGIRY
jgi:hypothetical protein